jgi:L-rhamnose mutarotase
MKKKKKLLKIYQKKKLMNLLDKTDEEIIEIANPIWDNLVKASNIKDYGGFTKDFSAQMLFGANEVELGKQWANNKLLTSLSKKKEVFGCLRRNLYVTVLYKQTSDDVPGEFLGRLVLGVEDDEIKVFGATIY